MATKGRSSTHEFVWSVEPPSEPFRLFKYCPRCRAPQCFRCAYRFRVNANRKFIDVWLLFDCARCGNTARLPVVRRLPASKIGRSRLRAFEGNDRDQAMAIARDRRLLKRAGFSVEPPRPSSRDSSAAPGTSVQAWSDSCLRSDLLKGDRGACPLYDASGAEGGTARGGDL